MRLTARKEARELLSSGVRGALTAVTLTLALASRGITRRSGFVIIGAYIAFVAAVVAAAT